MKKNKMMRLASSLMVAVLLTTSVISGTFAKYTTSASSQDSARVAKFGVTIKAKSDTENNLFKSSYADTAAGITVQADEAVVAPGTSGVLTNFVVEGTPEVDVTVTYEDATVELGNNWIDKDDINKFYCPIKITVSNNSGTYTLCGLDFETADAFEDAVEEKIKGAQGYYEAGENLNTVNDDLSISWSWDFEDAKGSKNDQSDVKDTFLGDRAAQDEGNAGTIYISTNCTITQVD